MRIKELREQKNISQEVLAVAIETSQRNIGRWENGENEPSYKQLIKIADFFGVTIDYLIGRNEDYKKLIKTPWTQQEERLLKGFMQLTFDEREKIIEDVEFFANKNKKTSQRRA